MQCLLQSTSTSSSQFGTNKNVSKMFYFSESCTLCVFTYFPAIFYKQLRGCVEISVLLRNNRNTLKTTQESLCMDLFERRYH